MKIFVYFSLPGSQWSPKSISGNLLLINGLLFALVIYNSFAAFITSVLSFKNVKIKDLEDLADSDFAFGYTLGNADELFLRVIILQSSTVDSLACTLQYAGFHTFFLYFRLSTAPF